LPFFAPEFPTPSVKDVVQQFTAEPSVLFMGCDLSATGATDMQLSQGLCIVETVSPVPGQAYSDDALMEFVKAGDQRAFRELVSRHLDRVYAVALRILGNRADAEDLAQDSFMRLWKTRDRWEPGRAQVGTWLYRVVVNRCIDLRRKSRELAVDEVPDIADDCASAVTTIHNSQMSRKLDDALTHLPEQQRAAVVLFYFEDMSNAEVAVVMDTTVGAVESLLKRARKKLRDIMRGSENDARHLFDA
jgi:RNA polymerase sigma-70 factor (ECF subfamily)